MRIKAIDSHIFGKICSVAILRPKLELLRSFATQMYFKRKLNLYQYQSIYIRFRVTILGCQIKMLLNSTKLNIFANQFMLLTN